MNLIAFDFGASNGRAMLGEFDGKQLKLSELHRFLNQPVTLDGGLYWDFDQLFEEVKTALLKCRDKQIDCIGIDTWGVDFGLLDKDGVLIRPPRHYRDEYTKGMMERAEKLAGNNYPVTGIQKIWFNTVYQLLAVAEKEPDIYQKADTFLFMPDLFSYMLTGKMNCEYTVASTSELLDASGGGWAWNLIDKLGLNRKLFPHTISKPGTIIGEIKEEFGLKNVKAAAVGSHDTASAVVSVPFLSGKNSAYISSGTWSLMGVELDGPCINERSEKYNFTNEGGVGDTIRFLKNIMGLWIIQQCREQWRREGDDISFGEMCELAQEAAFNLSFIEPDDDLFAPPGNMPKRVQDYCERTGQSVPRSKGEIVRCVLESLALKYRYTLECIEDILQKPIEAIQIVGGGTQNTMLCQLTADASGRLVTAGPVEATAIGNMIVQLMALGEIKDLKQGRQIVRNSFEIREFRPMNNMDAVYQQFLNVTGLAKSDEE